MPDETWKSTFCQTVRRLRREHHLTQKEMAQIIGIGLTSLRKIESGIYPVRLNVYHLCRIAEYFSLTANEILGPQEKTDAE